MAGSLFAIVSHSLLACGSDIALNFEFVNYLLQSISSCKHFDTAS